MIGLNPRIGNTPTPQARIEWLITMLEQKTQEVDMWVDLINAIKEN
jgi:hypothetical protein